MCWAGLLPARKEYSKNMNLGRVGAQRHKGKLGSQTGLAAYSFQRPSSRGPFPRARAVISARVGPRDLVFPSSNKAGKSKLHLYQLAGDVAADRARVLLFKT